MSGQDDDTDKSHEPSQKKLDDARKKGEIAKSNDLIVAGSYLGLLLAMLTIGATSMRALGDHLMVLLDQASTLAPLFFDGPPSAPTGGIIYGVGMALLPWFAIPVVAVLLVIIAQRAFVVTPSKLKFKLNRISLLSNAKNKFGRSGLFEFAKSFVKMTIYSVCLTLFIRYNFNEMIGAIQSSPMIISALLGQLISNFMFLVLIIAISIGGIDYMWQYQEHIRKNRMSRKEVTDEHKESEGDPHTKAHRRQKGQEIAMSQMMADVPDADVVIVNPTHYAVALKWSRQPGEAPICVAKGLDEVAKKIREIAQENGVPIRSDPPVARALHASVEIGDEIPSDHYRAVAVAIRFADAMRKKAWRAKR